MASLRLNREFLTVFLSICVQVPLAVYLGHFYDQRIFLETGYLVSSGLNPYQQHLITVFSNPHLTGLNPVIGYPPPWPLLLGAIYSATYNLTPNLFLYNFATKIPIIAANIALAYVTKTIMKRQNMPKRAVQFTWLFLLFNPFTLLTTTAWGQFDTLIALLCVSAIYLLSKGETTKSTLLLSLSFLLKPISLPLLGLPLLYSTPKNRRKNIAVLAIFAAVVATLWFLPFYLTGWAAPTSSAEVGSFFRLAGGMTLFNILDLTMRTADMPAGWWFLGYLWIPALLAAYLWVYRKTPRTLVALAEAAVVLLLVFFLARSWLSEQNINVLLPFLLILVGAATIKPRTLHLAWIILMLFLLLNASIPQLLFLVDPQIIAWKDSFDAQYATARLTGRFAVTVIWYVFALGLLFRVMLKDRLRQKI